VQIDVLRGKARQTPDKKDMHQEMVNICAFNPKAADLKCLLDCKCLPIRRESGEINWIHCESSEDFAIVDRRTYGAVFENKINMLDFSLEEVHQIREILVGLGLEHKFLSEAVKEDTYAEGGVILQRLTADIRRKAYAIARYVSSIYMMCNMLT
jgi:hypothetical protein